MKTLIKCLIDSLFRLPWKITDGHKTNRSPGKGFWKFSHTSKQGWKGSQMSKHCRDSRERHAFRVLIDVTNSVSKNLEINPQFREEENCRSKGQWLFLPGFQEASLLFSFKLSVGNRRSLECFSRSIPLF